MNGDLENRLNQVLEILSLEDKLLQDVADRLFIKAQYDEQWLTEVLNDSNLSDRLESFTSKFCRMQDNMVDKFLPLYLQQQGEITGSAIDNLRKLERIGLIENAEAWVEMRQLRNRLVHEYIRRPDLMLQQLLKAKDLAVELHQLYLAIR